jgi:glycosyltransferase involved in cell wall biosynthesis
MKAALAHHWLVGMRGGEKVLEQLALLFPGAPIYTLVANRRNLGALLRQRRIVESPLRLVPYAARYYKALLPLHPAAFRALKVRRPVDFVLSSDAAMAKGVTVPEGVPHICYCHSPPRYLWTMQETYLAHAAGMGAAQRAVFARLAPGLRQFDYRAAQRVDHFIANSEFVRQRIRDCYGREARVIHPPVDVEAFQPGGPPGDFDLVVSELTPYKRVDIAVQAYNRLGGRLVVIGAGSEFASLRAAAGPNVTFLGRQPFAVLKRHYETCRAFIFPGVEDFGITPLEAQAAGRPVIAYRGGGAMETVREGFTGMFFDEQTPEALAAAVRRFEGFAQPFSPAACRANAERFSPEKYRDAIKRHLAETLPGLFAGHVWPSLPETA